MGRRAPRCRGLINPGEEASLVDELLRALARARA